MNRFQYTTPRSIETALDAVADDGSFFAGGIDLLGEMKEGIAAPRKLVNVKNLPGTGEISPGEPHWQIGANVTVAALAEHEGIRKMFPGLADAAEQVASPQIRNVATVGGNLAQHSRCWYYRHRDVQCLKNGGSTCFAREGENRYHALFSGNPCISPVVSTLAVIFAALDARAIVQRRKEELRLSMAELYQTAWINPLAHNSLERGDLILRVEIPLARTRSGFAEVRQKGAFDWALVSAAAAARVEGGVLNDPRVALGSISPVPHQAESANAFLAGKKLTPEIADQSAEILLKDAQPLADNGYKIPMAKVVVRRALLKLIS